MIRLDTQGPAIHTGDLPIPLELKPGDTVLVDNGVIRLWVLEKLHRQMRSEVLTDGELGSRRYINLPEVKASMPYHRERPPRHRTWHLLDGGLLAKGDQVVIISDVLARDKLINAVQMRIVEQLGRIARKHRPACCKTWPTGCSLARREVHTLWNSTLRIGF